MLPDAVVVGGRWDTECIAVGKKNAYGSICVSSENEQYDWAMHGFEMT